MLNNAPSNNPKTFRTKIFKTSFFARLENFWLLLIRARILNSQLINCCDFDRVLRTRQYNRISAVAGTLLMPTREGNLTREVVSSIILREAQRMFVWLVRDSPSLRNAASISTAFCESVARRCSRLKDSQGRTFLVRAATVLRSRSCAVQGRAASMWEKVQCRRAKSVGLPVNEFGTRFCRCARQNRGKSQDLRSRACDNPQLVVRCYCLSNCNTEICFTDAEEDSQFFTMIEIVLCRSMIRRSSNWNKQLWQLRYQNCSSLYISIYEKGISLRAIFLQNNITCRTIECNYIINEWFNLNKSRRAQLIINKKLNCFISK